MAFHNELGKHGEKLAADFLQEKGYKILHQNWHYDRKEIDIVAIDKKMLVIVEVKTRSSTYFNLPEQTVSLQKQKFLIDAANAYIETFNIDLEVRFDIISIVFAKGSYKIDHLEDAFFPIW